MVVEQRSANHMLNVQKEGEEKIRESFTEKSKLIAEIQKVVKERVEMAVEEENTGG